MLPFSSTAMMRGERSFSPLTSMSCVELALPVRSMVIALVKAVPCWRCSSRVQAVSSSTGMCEVDISDLMRWVHSMPSMPGMSTSQMTRSGTYFAASLTPSAPLAAVMTL